MNKCKYFNPLYRGFIASSFGLIAVMTVATCIFITKGCHSEKYAHNLVNDTINTGELQLVKITPKEKEMLISDDLCFIPAHAFKEHVDSLNRILLKNQKNLYDRQADLVADIRQETNNNLDKISAWLAFWITVLGFVGIACPVAYQFLNYRNSEKELRQLSGKIKAEENRQKIVNNAYSIKMNVVAFNQLCENRLEDIDNARMRSLYISSVKANYDEFLKGIQFLSPDWKILQIHICSVLINIDTFLTKFREKSNFEESRRIRTILDLIPLAIDKISNEDCLKNVKDDLIKIQNKLQMI